jgi:hypothetical protein
MALNQPKEDFADTEAWLQAVACCRDRVDGNSN